MRFEFVLSTTKPGFTFFTPQSYIYSWNEITDIKSSITPQNNSHELVDLDIKGSKEFEGIIESKKSPSNMCYAEFPKLIGVISLERVGCKWVLRIALPPTSVERDWIMRCRWMDRSVDTRSDGNRGWYVNTSSFVGIPLSDDRLLCQERALMGKFNANMATSRHQLYNHF
jgi:hypothetical protein